MIEIITLVEQTALFCQTPGRSGSPILEQLSAYRELLTFITTREPEVAIPTFDSRNSNTFHVREVYAQQLLSGAIVSVVNTTFNTRENALGAAEAILFEFERVQAWREENYASLGEIDIGTAYQQLQEAVALTAGFLVEISFTLKQERSVTLTFPRTMIDLVAELYGEIDGQLDFFMSSNNLTGSEILELPRGRELVYYV